MHEEDLLDLGVEERESDCYCVDERKVHWIHSLVKRIEIQSKGKKDVVVAVVVVDVVAVAVAVYDCWVRDQTVSTV
jgi:hypothetical protein